MPEDLLEPSVFYVYQGGTDWAAQNDECDIYIDLMFYLRDAMTVASLPRTIHNAFLHELIHFYERIETGLHLSERNVDLLLQGMEGDEDLRGARNIIVLPWAGKRLRWAEWKNGHGLGELMSV